MDIQMLTQEAPTTAINAITHIVNHVYKEAEKGIWAEEQVRTNVTEIRNLAENNELAAARVDGKIAGCVRITRIDDKTGEFGMLAVDKAQQGTGLGRKLVHFAEEKLREAHVPFMQLKLLAPRGGVDVHPTKAFLYHWYTRLGYGQVDTELIEKDGLASDNPDQADAQVMIKLATPCQFLVFRKQLS